MELVGKSEHMSRFVYMYYVLQGYSRRWLTQHCLELSSPGTLETQAVDLSQWVTSGRKSGQGFGKEVTG